MEKKEELGKIYIYMLVLVGVFYLYVYIRYIFGAGTNVSGWEWLAFIILAIIALLICLPSDTPYQHHQQ